MQSLTLTAEQADAAFKALASHHRRGILAMLSAQEPDRGKTCCAPQEVCACRISDHLGLSPSTVSFHMTALLKGGLVTARKDGLWTYYTLRREVLNAICGEIGKL